MHVPKVTSIRLSSGIVASVVAGCFASLAVAVVSPLREGVSLSNALMSFLVYLPYGIFFNLFIGLPAFLFLAWRRLVQWWVWAPLSVIAAFVVELMLQGVRGFDIENIVFYAPVAIVCAAIFRLAIR